MTFRVEIFSNALSGGSVVVYDGGRVAEALLASSITAIPRKVDLYGNSRSLATAGVWNTDLYDESGLFSEDGLFSQDYRRTTIAASIGDRVVFVGRPEKLTHKAGRSGGLITSIRWRDLVDDLLAQRVEGIATGETEGRVVIAATTLHEILDAFGIPTYTQDLDGTRIDIPDIPVWHPEQSATLRQWILPAMAALGYAIDWSANITNGLLDSVFAVTHESRFRNRVPGIPVFTDASLFATNLSHNDGREQVANVWTGTRRTFDEVESEFVETELEERIDISPLSPAAASRSRFGNRRLPIDLSVLRVEEDVFLGYIRDTLSRRIWPHSRATMTLSGSVAAGLRIGDGFVSRCLLDTRGGRGLNRTWRVIGRSIDMRDEAVRIDAEARDGRDEDYKDWAALGYPTIEGDEDSARILGRQRGALHYGADRLCYGADALNYGGCVAMG